MNPLEQAEYIKILENREQTLDDSEKRTAELNLKHLDHKRAFLGTLMTIAAAIIVGLFLFINKDSGWNHLNSLAVISGVGLASFVVSGAIYLTVIFSQESSQISRRLDFIKTSKNNFIDAIGEEITDISSYEKYREGQYDKEKSLKKKVYGSHEGWFIFVISLFVIPSFLVIVLFLLVILQTIV